MGRDSGSKPPRPRTALAEEFYRGCDPRSLTMDPLSWAGGQVEPAVQRREQLRSSPPERGARLVSSTNEPPGSLSNSKGETQPGTLEKG